MHDLIDENSLIPRPAPQPSIARAAILFEGALIAIALFLGWVIGQPAFALLRWTWADLGWGLLATLPLVALLVLFQRYPVGPLQGLKQLLERSIVPLFTGCSLAELALISLLAGVGEEALFRGVAQPGLAQLGGSVWAGLLLASLLFGLAHSISATYLVLATVIGAYLGWLLIATGNLLGPIVAHAVYDFIALLYLLRPNRPIAESSTSA